MRLNDFTVKANDFRITASLKIAIDDLSGQSSSSTTSNSGIKPKKFTVNVLIAFAKAQDLTDLIAVAEAKDDNGALIVYDVVAPSINVANVRKVQFGEIFTWLEMRDLEAWRVQFSLTEYDSVPERIEERQEPLNSEPSTAPGILVSNDQEPEQTNTEVWPEYNPFESFLDNVDRSIV